MMAKPRQVVWATSLLWTSLALGLFTTVLDWSYERSLAPVSKLVSDLALTFLFLSFLIWKISQGRNWARIVYLVLFLFGGVFYFTFAAAAIRRSTAVAFLTILQGVMQFAALVLVFGVPGKDWFKASTRVSAGLTGKSDK
jgi:hypothetical protein